MLPGRWIGLFGICVMLWSMPIRAEEPVRRSLAEGFLGRTWEVDDGYPDVTATCFAQTGDGYLWIGTYSKLVRFDGQQFVEITSPDAPALGRSMILALNVDREDRLWVATSNGVGCYVRGRWRWYGPEEGVPEGNVRDVVFDGEGRVHVSRGNVLLRFTGERFEEVTLPLPSTRPGDPLRIRADETGAIWAVDHAWLARLEPEGWNILRSDDPAVETTKLTGLGTSRDGGIWLGWDDAIVKWRDGAWREILKRPEGHTTGAVYLLEDRRGGLWTGGFVSGLARIGREGEVETGGRAVGLQNPSIICLFEDAEGNIWVGTNGGGVTRLRPRSIRVSAEDEELSQSVVNSLVPYGDGFLLATHGGGVREWRRGRFGSPFWTAKPTQSSWPQTLVAEPDGRVWVGTFMDGLHTALPGDDAGLVRVPPSDVPGDNVAALVRDRAGALWVGTDVGVSIRGEDGGWTQWRPPGAVAPHPGIRRLAVADNGDVWLAGWQGGLWRWPRAEPDPELVASPDKAARSRVLAMIPAVGGGVWVTRESGEIGRHRAGDWQSLRAAGRLPAGLWLVMAADPTGHLWLSGDDGLMELSVGTPAAGAATPADAGGKMRIFTQADGLPPSGVRAGFQPITHIDAAGRVWFATYKGLGVIDPKRVAVTPRPPQPHIESVVVGSTVYPVDATRSEVVLPPLTRRATVNYTGVALGTPELVRFAVRIDGVDADWEDVGTLRHAQLLDFTPGRYVVEVRAGQNGVDSSLQPPARLVVVFLPAWWQTWWFRVAAVVVLGGGLILIVRAYVVGRHRRILEHSAQREALARERQEAREAREASAIAAAGSRAKSDFLATMSHEIRTPLNGVIGSAELLQSTELKREQAEHLRTLRSSAESLLGVLNDVLDFAKIEAGHVALDHNAFDLTVLACEVSEAGGPQLLAKHLEYGLVLDPALPRWLGGDAGRLRQVLLNLLGNALKFTERGEVALRIQREEGAPAGAVRVRFEVVDTGIGIAEEALPRVMERFTQADSSTTRRFGGTGLGLTICRSLVELMGGRIHVESTLGRGTRFWFSLDLPIAVERLTAAAPPPFGHAVVWECCGLAVEATKSLLERLGLRVVGTVDDDEARRALREAPPDGTVLLVHQDMLENGVDWPAERTVVLVDAGRAVTAPHFLRRPLISVDALAAALRALGGTPVATVASAGAEEGWRAPERDGRKPRILLVEDDPTSRRIGAMILTRMAAEVTVAINGEVAVNKCRETSFDLILMDCHMPVLDGLAATRAIRREEAESGERRKPIIALTANVIAEDRNRCFEVGMDDFLSKPIRMPNLIAALQRWLVEEPTLTPNHARPEKLT